MKLVMMPTHMAVIGTKKALADTVKADSYLALLEGQMDNLKCENKCVVLFSQLIVAFDRNKKWGGVDTMRHYIDQVDPIWSVNNLQAQWEYALEWFADFNKAQA